MHEITKTETEVFNARPDFIRAIGYYWAPDKEYALNDVALPSIPNGAQYKATTAGRSGRKEPIWPSIGTKSDGNGSLVWTKEDFDANAYDSISSVNIPAVTGLTIGAETITGTEVHFDISGGVKGSCYTVSVEATLASGEVVELKIQVVISDE